ncbi:hypothetical protein LXL04_014674 [Taraxacum kok-saghyz]
MGHTDVDEDMEKKENQNWPENTTPASVSEQKVNDTTTTPVIELEVNEKSSRNQTIDISPKAESPPRKMAALMKVNNSPTVRSDTYAGVKDIPFASPIPKQFGLLDGLPIGIEETSDPHRQPPEYHPPPTPLSRIEETTKSALLNDNRESSPLKHYPSEAEMMIEIGTQLGFEICSDDPTLLQVLSESGENNGPQ